MVPVGDRAADLFDFFHACRATQTHFLVRGCENRRAPEEGGQPTHLLDEVRSWPSQDVHPLDVPASHGRTARSTQVQLSFGSAFGPAASQRTASKPASRWRGGRSESGKNTRRRGKNPWKGFW